LQGTIVISSGPSFAADITGFATGLLISGLLLVLTLRAAKLPGTPLANIVVAVCGLLWSAGGLAETVLLIPGLRYQSGYAMAGRAVRYAAAATVCIPILGIWRPYAIQAWRKKAARLLYIFACAAAGTLAVLLIATPLIGTPPLPLSMLGHLGGLLCTAVLVAGAVISLRRESTPRAVYAPSLVIVLTCAAAALAISVAQHVYVSSQELARRLASLGEHLLLPLIFCTLVLFARFRYADIFVRYSVRIFLAGSFATMLGFTTVVQLPQHIFSHAPVTPAAHVLVVTLALYAVLLSFTFVDQRVADVVNRWLFHPPDFRAATRQLGDALGELKSESEVARAVEESVKATLQLKDAKLASLDALAGRDWPASFLDGNPTELAFEWLVPVSVSGRVSHVLLITPGPSRPGLVTHDINYLRAVSVQCGNRIDLLRREREAVEQRSRETLLRQQVTEAELRALRAQVNPHFLFNSLNTIADLAVRAPPRAEAMTLRLASVFRHVLAHSARPLTSVHDEMEFLRAYLNIEEVRFGDRLKVEIDVAPDVAAQAIPSLILQPLVENALKHGLGPKGGPGHLWISAHLEETQLCLRVEDDGIGPPSFTAEGTGLTNVRERLRTLYGDCASLSFGPREGGGSCVMLSIPQREDAKP
jgi:two-component system LytT family sensor kinase